MAGSRLVGDGSASVGVWGLLRVRVYVRGSRANRAPGVGGRPKRLGRRPGGCAPGVWPCARQCACAGGHIGASMEVRGSARCTTSARGQWAGGHRRLIPRGRRFGPGGAEPPGSTQGSGVFRSVSFPGVNSPATQWIWPNDIGRLCRAGRRSQRNMTPPPGAEPTVEHRAPCSAGARLPASVHRWCAAVMAT